MRVPFDVQVGGREAEATRVDGSPLSKTQSKEGSFLNPVGETANEVPPKAIGATMELLIFSMFVVIRALHPVIVTESKTMEDAETGKKVFPYQSASTCIVMEVGSCIFFIFFCWAKGGKQQFLSIFERKPLLHFAMNGAVYALGDILEMNSLGSLSAATYSIVQQLRIIVTALLLIPVKNLYQTRLQWTILFILMFGMSTYMCITSAGSSDSSSSLSDATMGLVFALCKVVVSCLGAVLTDKFTKKFKNDPTHVCMARTLISSSITLLILTCIPRVVGLMRGTEVVDVWSRGLFYGWDMMTVAVTGSFVMKIVSSLYVVALLDSILKNIGESFAILLIYGYDVLAPWVDKEFNSASFMAVLVVVAACCAYVDSKVVVQKASDYDAMQSKVATIA